jgi:hypothetical protein
MYDHHNVADMVEKEVANTTRMSTRFASPQSRGSASRPKPFLREIAYTRKPSLRSCKYSSDERAVQRTEDPNLEI